MSEALLVVDVQEDFMPWGTLPTAGGDEVVPVINSLQFERVIATRDWHPPGHGSFASTHGKQPGEVIELNGLQQILWPDHCVQGTKGAEFAAGLDTHRFERVFDKGIDRGIDSYGAFFDNGHLRATGLEEYLHAEGIDHLTVVGLTTDYCVKYTVLDALQLGFQVTVIAEGCRAISDHDGALQEMRSHGAELK